MAAFPKSSDEPGCAAPVGPSPAAAGWRFWLGLAAWMAGARLSAGWELGPVYIIVTLIALMLLNLGQRREVRAARAQE